jgi:hypothetical protein
MKTLKHIGKLKNTGAKVLVVFRTLPGESNQALVLPVAQLPDSYHDAIMTLVETDEAQQSFEFGEIMFARLFPDGRPMLQAMQADNRLIKTSTDNVSVTPSPTTEIRLDELNVLIAEQRNVAVDDLYTLVKGAPKKSDAVITEAVSITETPAPVPASNEPLSDKDIAKGLRSQADALYKEAARLRREADNLDPVVKKTSKAKEDVSA